MINFFIVVIDDKLELFSGGSSPLEKKKFKGKPLLKHTGRADSYWGEYWEYMHTIHQNPDWSAINLTVVYVGCMADEIFRIVQTPILKGVSKIRIQEASTTLHEFLYRENYPLNKGRKVALALGQHAWNVTPENVHSILPDEEAFSPYELSSQQIVDALSYQIVVKERTEEVAPPLPEDSQLGDLTKFINKSKVQ